MAGGIKAGTRMKPPLMGRLPTCLRLAVCALVLAATSSTTLARDATEIETRLETLRTQIAEISQRLAEDLAARDREQQRLAETERSLGRLLRELRETERELDEVRERIDDLETEAGRLEAGLAEIEQALAGQLRAAYRLGNQSRVKILLSRDDPRQLNRLLAWHGYLGRARLAIMTELYDRLEALAAVRDEQLLRHSQLDALHADQTRILAAEQHARGEHATAVAEFEARIRDRRGRLAELEQSAAELAALLEQLADVLADIPPDIESPPLADLRGRLPLPVEGRIRARFGDQRSGEIRWSGWLIGTAHGSEVRAIAHGRVAYADWLRGYGMLLILDHGDGFLSLYAHNETLLRDVGDWVNQGQAIATVGGPVGASEPGLYFELRRDGRAIDPAGWFQH